MKPPTIQSFQNGPEEKIVEAIWEMLEEKGWIVLRTHGNQFQSGLPDLWAGHPVFGHRWIEVKNPVSYCFTIAQLKTFPILTRCGDGVWILIGADQSEYDKLFLKPNWAAYLWHANNTGSGFTGFHNKGGFAAKD